MNEKRRTHVNPRVLTHVTLGLGLGVVLTAAVPELRSGWLGAALMGIALALDATRRA